MHRVKIYLHVSLQLLVYSLLTQFWNLVQSAHVDLSHLAGYSGKGKYEIQLLLCSKFKATIWLNYHVHFVVDWCYKDKKCGPDTWKDQCPSNRAQSPINIVKRTTKNTFANATIVMNDEYFRSHQSCYLQNTGHTIQLTIESSPISRLFFKIENS